MGSHSCFGPHVGLLQGLRVKNCGNVGRDVLQTRATGKSTRQGDVGGGSNPGKCDALRCQCRVAGKEQGQNANAVGLETARTNDRFLGMERSFSQTTRQKSDRRTFKQDCEGSSVQFRDSILGSSSLGGKDSDTLGGFLMTSSSGSKGHVDMLKRLKSKLSMRTLAIAACFGGIAGFMKALLSTLPPDFESRWRSLFDDKSQAEAPSEGGSQSPTVLFDRHGVVIATIAPGGYSYERDATLQGSSGKSLTVSPAEIPSWMWQAVVASEDRRFFKHQGIDPRGVSRAILSLAASGGGSTITQQLVKNVFLSNERKWTRKLLEIILAFVLEKQISKWDILHLYLKKIYWGHGVYGIEGASALYFGKHPSFLSLGECAMLAGIIPAPELLSPYRDPSRGKKPQARALRRMVEAGFLDVATAAEAVRQPLRLAIESSEGTSGPWKAPYFVSEVLYELTQKYGWSKVARGGLQVHTTLDLSMQTIAEKVVQDAAVEYDNERILLSDKGLQKTQKRLVALQGERQEQMTKVVEAVLRRSVENSGNSTKLSGGNGFPQEASRSKTRFGAITSEELDGIATSIAARKAAASVVQRFFTAEEYLQATVFKYQEEIKNAEQARMEAALVAIDPMSGAVRVLVGGRDYYESNFNRGTQAFRSPGSTFKPVVYLTALAEGFEWDHELMDEPFTIGGFTPENYDQKFRGQVTLEQSLLYSLNVPTVRLCHEVGVDKVCEMGRALGIETFLPHELALSLGGCEVTPMQLATVYATIAAGGIYHKPHLITLVETCEGQILEEHKPSRVEQQTAVVDESAIAELRRLLQAVVDKGTGRAARLGRPCAGKTGTSNEHRDIWFAGFTPEISCAVWLGYDDNAPIGGLHPATGASHAAPLWKQFMKIVHEGIPVRKFHDIGSDQYGGRAPRQFEKRSRRCTRVGLHKIRRHYQKKKENIPWKQVWDWEKASIAWDEQEKMEDWATLRARKTAGIPDWAAQWRPCFVDHSLGVPLTGA